MAYRAFYAIANLSTKAGRPTNAVYGFIRLLRQLQQTWKPSHWLVTFDVGMPAERLALLPTYKAQRKEMPDALRSQFDPINEYLNVSGVPSLLMDGVEADDLMASYVHQAEGSCTVLLATSDKDMFQLVNDRVTIVSLTKAGERMGPKEVHAKTGVRPDQIVSWLALTGDTADNIPGVPGVGPKTAAKLLEQFQTLDAMWAGLDQVESDRLRANLLTHRADVDRNIKMASLRRDLVMEKPWNSLLVTEPKADDVLPFLDKMEFHVMARTMRDEASRLL